MGWFDWIDEEEELENEDEESDDEQSDEDDESDDDESDDDDGDDDDESDEDPAMLVRLEAVFRAERAKIKTSNDVAALRTDRAAYQRQVASGELKGAVAVRGNDLMELIDDRLIEIKAKQLADRKS